MGVQWRLLATGNRFAQAGHHFGHGLAKRRGALGEDGDAHALAFLAFALVAALGQEQIGLVVAGLLEVEEVGLGPGFDDYAVIVLSHVNHLLSGRYFRLQLCFRDCPGG